MMESMHTYNNTNLTDLTKGLITIDSELESEDVKSLKFLCQDHISIKTLEKIRDGLQIFNELERIGKIDTSTGEVDYLLECLCRCRRMDLIRKMGFDQIQVKNRVENCQSNFSTFRIMLFEIAEEMETTDLKTALFSLSTIIPRSKHDKIESMYDVFTYLERSGDLTPLIVDVLHKLLKMLDRGDLIVKVKNFQGIVTTGNTEPGYGPVDEGQVSSQVGPIDNVGVFSPPMEFQNTARIPDPVHTSRNQHYTQSNQYQTSTTNDVQHHGSVIDIQGQDRNKNGRQKAQISEQLKIRMKMEDRASERVLPGDQDQELQNSMNTEQEQPSMEVIPSAKVVNNQISFPRTGTSQEVPNHHLVPRNDVLEEEESLGSSGLTAGTVSLSDRSSQEFSESASSGEVLLSLTEGKMTGLSEVIARHEDWGLLATALNVDYETLTQIMKSNPTKILQVHGLLKHWYFTMREQTGNIPSAEGLLGALRSIGFDDVIQEYVRLSQEPEREQEPASENYTATSEGSGSLNDRIFSSGEPRFGGLDDMDLQGPANPVVVTSSSVAQVGPSLDPLINQSHRQSTRQDDVIVRQMATVAIDDSVMPFYKMNSRPRGIAIIINNQKFHKIRGDPQSKEMPERTGTERDAEKLDYIWRKLDFEVKRYDNVDSTKMIQIMVETALNIDHTNYDCLVCCILTHGVLGHVYGTDGRIVRINQLTGCFSSRRCQTLAGKPKMFFIQACQGRDKQEGHEIESDSAPHGLNPTQPRERQDVTVDRPRELIPDEADFLLGYATVPGYVSYRSRSQGSWFINKLAQNLDKYAYQHDLLSILIKVNEEVGRATANIENGYYKQIPAPMFTLRKRIIFR